MRHLGFLTLSIVLFATSPADAKLLCVNASGGSDANTYAANNGTSVCWATLGRAAWGSANRNTPSTLQAAQAGDTVHVFPGTYTGPGTNNRFDPTFRPVNSGNISNPIVFEATGTVHLAVSGGLGPSPVIGADGQHYITWRGFTMNELNAPPHPDTGMVTVHNGSTGVVIEGNTIIGNPSAGVVWDDNHTGIRLENAPFTTIRNNVIRDIYNLGQLSNQENGACIQAYFNNSGLLIENNEIFNCGAGIALKAVQPNQTAPATVRFNLIYGCESGIVYHIVLATAANPTLIYQNIIRDGAPALYDPGSVNGIKIRHFTGADQGPLHGKIVNNTIDNVENGLLILNEPIGGNSNIFWNNIITNTQIAIANIASDATVAPSVLDFEHNLYFAFSTVVFTGNANRSMSTWQTTYSQDNASPASTSTQNPMYVDVGAEDFHLQAGSPALSGGIDILDLNHNISTVDAIPRGAYVSGTEVIGLLPSGLPSQVLGLRIVPGGL